jgi:Arc-like DNA binding domain
MQRSINHGDPIVNTTVVHYSRAMTREDPQMKIRLPAEMRDRIAAAAEASGRSMNAEIIARLEASFSGGGDNASLLATIARLNLDVALGEMEKQGLKADAANLAISLQQAADLLLKPLEKSEEARHGLVKNFIEQAQPHLENANALVAGLPDQLEGVRNAVRELSQARANLVATLGTESAQSQAPSAQARAEPPQPSGGIDLDELEQAKPPSSPVPTKRAARVLRPAPKRNT